MKQDPKNANKPDAILEKIAEGKMRKFFEENTLLNQLVVGEKETIAELIRKADKEATVIAYKRFKRWRHSFSGRRSSGFRASAAYVTALLCGSGAARKTRNDDLI